jgi:predicted GIY-YIG superfamily endonuclease
MAPVVYVLRLRSGQVYIGSTTQLGQRLADHASGYACRTTNLDPPVALLHLETFDSFSSARHREAQLKRWSLAKKEALVRGDVTVLRRLARSRETHTTARGVAAQASLVSGR